MWMLRVLRVAAILTPILPARLGYALCRLAGILLFLVHRDARRNALDNLRHVDPRLGPLAAPRAAARVFITVVTNYYDLLRLRSVDRDAILDLVELRGREHLDRALAQGRGVIILSAHLGNFNVVAQYPVLLGYRTAVIAERVQPPELFRYLTRLRSKLGIEVIPPGPAALRPILRLLHQNGILLVAGDRHVAGQAHPTRFFDADALLPAGPVLLAMRTGAALIPAYTVRLSTRRSLVVIEPPIDLVRTGGIDRDLAENLARTTRRLEAMIATDPGQWAVLQAVWRPERPKPVPRGTGLGGVPVRLEDQRGQPAIGAGEG